MTMTDLVHRVAARVSEGISGEQLADVRALLPEDMETWSREQAEVYAQARRPDFDDLPMDERHELCKQVERVLDALAEEGIRLVDSSGEVRR